MNNVEFSVLSLEELFSINGGSSKAGEYIKAMQQARRSYRPSTSSQSSSQSSSRKTSSNTGGGSKKTATQSAPKGKK